MGKLTESEISILRCNIKKLSNEIRKYKNDDVKEFRHLYSIWTEKVRGGMNTTDTQKNYYLGEGESTMSTKISPQKLRLIHFTDIHTLIKLKRKKHAKSKSKSVVEAAFKLIDTCFGIKGGNDIKNTNELTDEECRFYPEDIALNYNEFIRLAKKRTWKSAAIGILSDSKSVLYTLKGLCESLRNKVAPLVAVSHFKSDIPNNKVQNMYHKFDPKMDASVIRIQSLPLNKYQKAPWSFKPKHKKSNPELNSKLKNVFNDETKERCDELKKRKTYNPESSQIYALRNCKQKIEGDSVLDDAVFNTAAERYNPSEQPGRIFISTRISINGAYYVIKKQKLTAGKIAIVNFADFRNAGGGVAEGSEPQEEDLYRRTDMVNHIWRNKTIMDNFYALNTYLVDKYKNAKSRHEQDPYAFGGIDDICGNDRAIFTDDVECILGGEIGSYEPRSRSKDTEVGLKFSVVSIPAIDLRNYYKDEGGNKIVSDSIKKTMESRIKLMLLIPAANKVDTLVTGAFGCGIFKWDTHEVAAKFKKILIEQNRRSCFRNIIFAMGSPQNGLKVEESTTSKIFRDTLGAITVD